MKRIGTGLFSTLILSALGAGMATQIVFAQGGNGQSASALEVTRVGVGSCADLTATSPSASVEATGAATRLRLEIDHYRYACNTEPAFAATLTDHTIRLQPPSVTTADPCVCLHSETLQISTPGAGRYTVEIWSPRGDATPRWIARTTIDTRTEATSPSAP